MNNWACQVEPIGAARALSKSNMGQKNESSRTTFDFSLGTVGEQTKPIYIGERPAQIHRPISAWLKSRAAYINWIDMT